MHVSIVTSCLVIMVKDNLKSSMNSVDVKLCCFSVNKDDNYFSITLFPSKLHDIQTHQPLSLS